MKTQNFQCRTWRQMKNALIFIGIAFLVLLVGCNKTEITEKEAPKEPVAEVANASVPVNVTLNETTEQEETMNETNINETVAEINNTNNTPGGTHIVGLYKTLLGMEFMPKEINISVGETVMWINKMEYMDRKVKLKVQAHLGEFESPILAYGDYYGYTFNKTGEYTYSTIPYREWFKIGKVIVR